MCAAARASSRTLSNPWTTLASAWRLAPSSVACDHRDAHTRTHTQRTQETSCLNRFHGACIAKRAQVFTSAHSRCGFTKLCVVLSEWGVYIQVGISFQVLAYGISLQMEPLERCTKIIQFGTQFGPCFEVWVDVPPQPLLHPRMLHHRLASPHIFLIFGVCLLWWHCGRNTPPFLVCARPRARRRQESVQSLPVPVCTKIKRDSISCKTKQRN